MKALVLLSGGIDSTTCLALAINKFGTDNVIALSIEYGQKHEKEVQAALNVAAYYGVRYFRRNLSEVFEFSKCSLLQGNEDIEHKSYAEQLQEKGGEGTVSTYVPFRNGLFLAYASAMALSLRAEVIYYGAHSDDAAGRAYPDCTEEFESAMGAAIYQGSGKTLRLEAPLLGMNKASVVEIGLSIGAPYQYTWSCYEGKDRQCGTCGTCIDRRKAFEKNNWKDPVPYEVEA